jgi:hypothetical protein
MSIPVTNVLDVQLKPKDDVPHIIVMFKGKQYRIDNDLSIFIKKGRGYYILKTPVGKGLFKDLLKQVSGVRLPSGYKQK